MTVDGYIAAAGGINVDIKGKSFERMVLGSSNPGAIEISPGGVACNISRNLALLNVPVMLLSVIGSDAQGAKALQDIKSCGVCVDHVSKADDGLTGTYIALLDNMGEMTAALSDMRILEKLDIAYFKSRFDILEKASLIVCDANLPEESIIFIASAADKWGIPLCLEPVSVRKALKLKNCLKGIDYITPNLDELRVLTGLGSKNAEVELMATQLIESGVSNVITSLGKEGLCYTTAQGSKHYQSFPAYVTDVTGAGDSLTAGFLYGLMKYGNIDKSLICGLAAAAITISSEVTVSPRLSEDRISELVHNYRNDSDYSIY